MNNEDFMKEVQKKFGEKVKENEISVVGYWKERLDKLAVMKPEGIASLQVEIKKLSDMMETRITTLKRTKD
jgi:hypothetical protein